MPPPQTRCTRRNPQSCAWVAEAPLTAAKAGSAAPAANIALAATLDIANGVDVILTGEVDGHMIDSMADAKPVLKTSTPDAPNTPNPRKSL